MTKRRKRKQLKTGVKRFLIYFVVFLLISIYAYKEGYKIYKQYEYEKTDEYKIITIGYEKDQAQLMINNLTDEQINFVKDNEYNEMYYKFITQKYFLLKNYNKYIDYQKMNPNKDKNKSEEEYLKEIVALVNTHASSGWYNVELDTDTSQGDAILVNKFYKLNQDYIRDDIVKAQLSYSYADNSASEKVLLAYKEMRKDVEDELNVRLMINSSYRSYEDQQKVYDERKVISLKYADSIAARPGHSEHQTGLAIDITSLEHPTQKSFTESEEYKWLKNNCHKYGFILRYPEGKENITGYNTESWHFRYVGKEIATKIYEEQITFDEYYAYYIEGNN